MVLWEESSALLKLLRGERVCKPPFWEPWFDMGEFLRRRYGDPEKIENRIEMAHDLRMAAVKLGSVDINASFRTDEVATDGSRCYDGGSLVSLKQLEQREVPDWSKTIQQWKRDEQLIKQAGSSHGSSFLGASTQLLPRWV